MIIKPVDKNIIRIIDEDMLYTIIESYGSYDGIHPIYTIIKEDAYASPLEVISDLDRDHLNKHFKSDISLLFNS